MQADFVLVNAPFAAPNYPSIQVGLLQALADRRGVSTAAAYANLSFFARLKRPLYELISDHRGIQIGDWLFSKALFLDTARSDEFLIRFNSEISALCAESEIDISYLNHVRNVEAVNFVNDTAEAICAFGPKAVGFSSTFEQNISSLAIAKAVKGLDPAIITVFGGANFDGEMGAELFKRMEWIDAVVIGEVEPCFDGLLDLVGLAPQKSPSLDGILSRIPGKTISVASRATYRGSLDDIPAPRYHDYFTALKQLNIDPAKFSKRLSLPFEGSRGCWWGQKHHCTFCGLNGDGMAFRKKSPARVLEEIDQLATEYGVSRLSAVDNIVSPDVLSDVCKTLEQAQTTYNIFYEIKANLKREDIRDIANAGIDTIQPGIESLSTPVLKLMKKGIRSIQNINTLRWCHYYNVQVSWNLLYGFPGETLENYQSQLSLLKKLEYLPPPAGGGRIWLERFSPYYTGKEKGFDSISPEKSLSYIYPDDVDLNKVAYFFTGSAPTSISDTEYRATEEHLACWKNRWGTDATRPYLYYSASLSQIKVFDGRADPEKPVVLSYKNPLASALRFMSDRPRSFAQIADHLSTVAQTEIPSNNISAMLERLQSRDFLVKEDDLYLFLPLPLSRPMK